MKALILLAKVLSAVAGTCLAVVLVLVSMPWVIWALGRSMCGDAEALDTKTPFDWYLDRRGL